MEGNITDVILFFESPTETISDEAFTDSLIFWSSLWLAICCFGIWSNVIIIRTFVKMGLDDSITISFFALGISDLCQISSATVFIVTVVFMYAEAKFAVYFKVLPTIPSAYVAALTVMFNNLTTYITTFLAVQRCLCIIRPLHFKDMFSKTLTWCLMFVFFSFASVSFVAYAYSLAALHFWDPFTNRSYYILSTKPAYSYVDEYVGSILIIFLPIINQCIVVGSVIIMVYGLTASVQFRKNMSGAKTTLKTSNAMDEKTKSDIHQKEPVEEIQRSKERTAIVQVVMLSVIYLITSIPKIMHALAIIFVSGFGIGGFYENLFKTTLYVRLTFEFINSSVNFFIYNKYNTRFRQLCHGERQETTS